MPTRPSSRRSVQERALAEARAADELARRRVRAVGRCPECAGRVEPLDDWVRVGDDPWHASCADHAALVEAPLERRHLRGAR